MIGDLVQEQKLFLLKVLGKREKTTANLCLHLCPHPAGYCWESSFGHMKQSTVVPSHEDGNYIQGSKAGAQPPLAWHSMALT